jgi:hypothetical protein
MTLVRVGSELSLDEEGEAAVGGSVSLSVLGEVEGSEEDPKRL